MTIRNILFIVAAIPLASCANAVKPSDLAPMRIADVRVTVNPNVQAHSDVASKVAASGRAAAAAYNAYMPANAPQRVVNITVDKIHYKGAAMSLLVGDSNYISGIVSGGSAPTSSVTYADVGSGAVNGLIGAAIAAGTNKANTDSKLAVGLADKAIAKAHGQDSVPKFVRQHMSGRPMRFDPNTDHTKASRPTRGPSKGGVIKRKRTQQTVQPIGVSTTTQTPARQYRGTATAPKPQTF